MSDLERIGVSLDSELLLSFDLLIEQLGYQNRSEAFRDLIRERLSRQKLENPDNPAVAAVFLVYDHHQAQLPQKLISLQHNHLLHVQVSTHIHLDHHNCLEIIILKGKVKDIELLGNNLTSLKGVKLSKINLIPAAEHNQHH